MNITFLFISFFLSVTLCIISTFGIIMNFQKTQNPCFSVAAKIQNKNKILTKRLLNLNTQASQLRIERRLAEKAVKSAKDPYSLSAATAYLSLVVKRQFVLKGLQTTLKESLRLYSKVNLSRLKLKIKASTPQSIRIQVYPKPKHSLTPSYYLKKNYSTKQNIKIKAYINLFKHFPNFIKKKFNLKSRLYKINCGATLIQKGGIPSRVNLTGDIFW